MTLLAARPVVVTDPATGEVLAELALPTAEELDAAVAAVRAVQPGWARTPAAERGAVLRSLAAAVRAHAEELAALQTSENGKPRAMSLGDVGAAAGTLEQYAELGPLHRGRSLVGAWSATDLMVAEPYGVAAVVVPWNDPLGITAGLLGACLVTGNGVVLKPSERAPLAVTRMLELLDDAAPVRVLVGDGSTGAALIEHPGIDLVCHVGSMATGQRIAARCGSLLRKAILELGGNDPLIVDAGVDPAWAAREAASGAFANSGQICTAVERIYVHRDVADAFVEALDAEARAVELGPLVDERQRREVAGQVDAALERGARALTGGAVPDGPGWHYPATVLVDVDDEMSVMTDETFGPVAPVRVVDSFEEALRLANASDYGLAASVLTPSQEHAQRAWRELRAGTVKINAVWGGAPGGAAEPHARSGMSFGYGPELLDEVTLTKVVHLGVGRPG